MKTMKKILTIGLAVVCMLCMSGCSIFFFENELRKFPIECNRYALAQARYVDEDKILDYQSFGYNYDFEGEQEVYNQDGLRIVQKNTRNIHSGPPGFVEFTVYTQDKTWHINQEFMERSKTFVAFSTLWGKWDGGKAGTGDPNEIWMLSVSSQQEIFIITQSLSQRMIVHLMYPVALWFLDTEQGTVQYCGYLKGENGHPVYGGRAPWDMVIIKNEK